MYLSPHSHSHSHFRYHLDFASPGFKRRHRPRLANSQGVFLWPLFAQRGKLEGLKPFRRNWKPTNSKEGITPGTRGRREWRKRHSVTASQRHSVTASQLPRPFVPPLPPSPPSAASPGSWNAECFQKPRRNMNLPHQQFPRGPWSLLEQLASRARSHVPSQHSATRETRAPSFSCDFCLELV